jgi:hypothetical protein
VIAHHIVEKLGKFRAIIQPDSHGTQHPSRDSANPQQEATTKGLPFEPTGMPDEKIGERLLSILTIVMFFQPT